MVSVRTVVAIAAIGLVIAACGTTAGDGIATKANAVTTDGGSGATAPPLTEVDAGCVPDGAEVCDGKDNDCNGQVDDNLPQSTEDCTAGLGACAKTGHKTCVSGTPGCSATPGTPTAEACDGVDTDCDGQLDPPTCACVDGTTQACGKSSLGSCKMGTQSCSGGQWQPCVGNIDPKDTDSCAAGNDDNCDGIVTNGPIPNDVCSCLEGAKSDCATIYKLEGPCAKGAVACTGGQWGECASTPAAQDTCDTGNDANCDGIGTSPTHLPPACACINGTQKQCGQLHPSLKGSCAAAYSVCTNGAFAACPAQVAAVDKCDGNNDDNCDGVASNGPAPNSVCQCYEGYGYPCQDVNAGTCNGTKVCTNGTAGVYGACQPAGGLGNNVAPVNYCYDGDGDGHCAYRNAEGHAA